MENKVAKAKCCEFFKPLSKTHIWQIPKKDSYKYGKDLENETQIWTNAYSRWATNLNSWSKSTLSAIQRNHMTVFIIHSQSHTSTFSSQFKSPTPPPSPQSICSLTPYLTENIEKTRRNSTSSQSRIASITYLCHLQSSLKTARK